MTRVLLGILSLFSAVNGVYGSALVASSGAVESPSNNAASSNSNANAHGIDGSNEQKPKFTLNVSPQDKAYDSHKSEDGDSFHAPDAAPNDKQSDATYNIQPVEANSEDTEKGSKGSVILADYDSNRLGVSADEAKTNKADEKKPKLGSVVESKNNNNKAKPKSEKDALNPVDENKASTHIDRNQKTQHKNNAEKDELDREQIKEVELLKEQGLGPESSGSGTPPVESHTSSGYSGRFANSISDRFQRFLGSAAMIIASEIGDKTFFIAALMAMRHRPLFVFSSSYSAMVIMTLLSMFLGLIIPSLLSRRLTTLVAALLFIIFAVKMFKEAYDMDKTLLASGEMEEVEHDLELSEQDIAREKAEMGGYSGEQDRKVNMKSGVKNLANLIFPAVWIQIFVMTFLAEWGDRSQIATVAMGAGEGFMPVLFGCLLGHFVTTVISVLGGKMLAAHLSLRIITLSGAICFLFFGIFYFSDWLKQ